jgi:hypothetical protein
VIRKLPIAQQTAAILDAEHALMLAFKRQYHRDWIAKAALRAAPQTEGE